MSEGGTKKERLKVAEAAWKAEMELWNKSNMSPMMWRMGDFEFQVRCELIALMEILREHLKLDDDDFQIAFHKALVKVSQEIRPVMEQARSAALRNAIVDGVNVIKPNIDL